MADLSDSRPRDAGKMPGIERAAAIVAELTDAVGAGLLAAAEEQGVIAADKVSAVAEAARCAARSLDQSGSPAMARGVDRAAGRIDDIAGDVRGRNWREIAGETADFARRRPGLFGLGAISLGFLLGRLLTLPADRGAPDLRPPTTAGSDGKAAAGGDGARPYREAP
jgi:hypothetical protein